MGTKSQTWLSDWRTNRDRKHISGYWRLAGWVGKGSKWYQLWVSFGDDENVLKLMFAQFCKYTKYHSTVYFKELNCMVCIVVVLSLSHVQLFVTPWTVVCPWHSPGKIPGVGYHFLLQGTFLTQGSNTNLLHWQASCLPPSHQGSMYWLVQKFVWVFP